MVSEILSEGLVKIAACKLTEALDPVSIWSTHSVLSDEQIWKETESGPIVSPASCLQRCLRQIDVLELGLERD
jgi:hypothetical protein